MFSLANLRVKTLLAGTRAPGPQQATWDGTDDATHEVPVGAYWIIFSGDGHDWAELVFKDL